MIPRELKLSIDGMIIAMNEIGLKSGEVILRELMALAEIKGVEISRLNHNLERVNARVGQYVDEIEEMVNAIERSGYDVSPCSECGQPTVCIPDGMPLCEPCGTKDNEAVK